VTTSYLCRPEGRIAYEIHGDHGPWVICVPGMGDLREEYRLAVPPLVGAGYRAVTLDLRGHGQSDTQFSSFSSAAIGGDIVALVEALGAAHVSIAGTSMGAAAAVWAAAELGPRVTSLILLGPFVRDLPLSAAQKLLFAFAARVLFAGPWGAFMWSLYYRSLYRSNVPADFGSYQRKLRANLSEPGRLRALSRMFRAPKHDCEARLAELHVPALVVMGTADPDFSDPSAEGKLVAERLGGELLLVEKAGHYPHAEAPERVMPRVLHFLAAHAQ
jgi:pimeloyl-ACP methyl ester carboxylesterase